jgi:hypothetical protein
MTYDQARQNVGQVVRGSITLPVEVPGVEPPPEGEPPVG